MRTLLTAIPSGIAASAVATFAKTKAEQALQPVAEQILPPTPAQKTTIGGDPAGHPENMPPSELADRARHAVTGDELSDDQRAQASDVLHWAMGVGAGTAYAVLARRWPVVRTGHGSVAGAALFAATHLTTLPATGLQHPPSRLPTAWWIWEGGSHVVYGVVLDTALRAADWLLQHRGTPAL